MKKIIAILVCVVMCAALFAACTPETQQEVEQAVQDVEQEVQEAAETPTEAPAEEAPAEEEPIAEEEPAAADASALQIGFYADAADSYYQVMCDALIGATQLDDATKGWTVDYKIGQSTADEQLKAVEDFITAGYDAIIVIQNNPNTTSECITKCTEAGIPYFGAAHYFGDVPNATDAAGSSAYDFTQCGVFAGEDALAKDVSKLVMIEGVLGQGSAGAQSLGFLKAYEDAGKNLGGVTAEDLATKKTEATQDGSQDIEVVQWASGGWMAEPAQKAMADAITSLGPDGFDGVYVQNNPMAEGVFAAMEEAGISPSDYWIGSSNGREISWDWCEAGQITMDVNQPASLEGTTLYQQIKAYFAGEEYRKYIHPYLTAYNQDNIVELRPSLVPVTDVDNFLLGYQNNDFVTDINDAKFLDQPGFGK